MTALEPASKVDRQYSHGHGKGRSQHRDLKDYCAILAAHIANLQTDMVCSSSRAVNALGQMMAIRSYGSS